MGLALENKYNKKMEFITADIRTPEGDYLAQKFYVDLIPRFFILDDHGKVAFTEVGEQSKDTLEKEILQVLEKSKQ